MPDPNNPGDRVQAHKLRKRLKAEGQLEPVHALWLAQYEDARKKKSQHANGTSDVGASRKSRTISLDIDEHAEAVGTGEAAVVAASAALREREEGRRLDSLTMHSTDALKEACAVYKDMCLMLKDQVELMMTAVTESMIMARTEYLARAQVEAQLIGRENAERGNPADEMMMAIVAKQLGIDPVTLRGGIAAAQQQQDANGVAGK